MSIHIRFPEVVGVSDTSMTLAFCVEDESGPVDAEARIAIGGETRAQSSGAVTRLVRIEGLEPGTEYAVDIVVDGADAPERDRYFPPTVVTHPAPRSREVASIATLNDLHFGETRMGGVLTDDHEYGDEAPGFAVVDAGDTPIPYPRFMNEDAIDEINTLGVDTVVIKGDIADRGLPEQFAEAARAFARFEMPHHAFLGNHDYLGVLNGLEVDGYGLLDQEPAPRSVELAGWRLVLLETAVPGEHHGAFGADRLAWLDETLLETQELGQPTLLLMHHQPVPPEHRHSYPNMIGIDPAHSLDFFELVGQHPQVRAVLIGHTHRNRVRLHSASGATPYVEINNSKDYPGGFAHYRLFEDGSFRQEVRRTSSERALSHATRCRDLFDGQYRHFAMGALDARSFVAGSERI